jgi:hypothetical protein
VNAYRHRRAARLSLLAVLALSSRGLAQSPPCVEPTTIAPLVNRYFGLISGASGPRDWGTFRRLFWPTARIDAVGINEEGANAYHPQSLDEFIQHYGDYLRHHGLHQRGTRPNIRCFARVAHVSLIYESRNEPAGPVIDRGWLSLHFLHDTGEWRIAHLLWNSETRDFPLAEAP